MELSSKISKISKINDKYIRNVMEKNLVLILDKLYELSSISLHKDRNIILDAIEMKVDMIFKRIKIRTISSGNRSRSRSSSRSRSTSRHTLTSTIGGGGFVMNDTTIAIIKLTLSYMILCLFCSIPFFYGMKSSFLESKVCVSMNKNIIPVALDKSSVSDEAKLIFMEIYAPLIEKKIGTNKLCGLSLYEIWTIIFNLKTDKKLMELFEDHLKSKKISEMICDPSSSPSSKKIPMNNTSSKEITTSFIRNTATLLRKEGIVGVYKKTENMFKTQNQKSQKQKTQCKMMINPNYIEALKGKGEFETIVKNIHKTMENELEVTLNYEMVVAHLWSQHMFFLKGIFWLLNPNVPGSLRAFTYNKMLMPTINYTRKKGSNLFSYLKSMNSIKRKSFNMNRNAT